MAPEVGEGLSDELKTATLAGVRWMAIARVTLEVVGFAATVVLAHLIPPAEYGRVAVALILSMLAIGLTNEGFGNPIVQRRTVEREHLEVAGLMCLGLGVGLMLATLALAPLVATPLFGGRVTELVQLASPIFALVSVGIVPYAQLQRRLEFRRVSLIDTGAWVTGFAAMIVLALTGLDGEAIVLGTLLTGALTSGLYYASAPAPRPRWHRHEAREITDFGGPAALASLVGIGFKNIDYAILAAKTGAAQVGFYYRAFGLAMNYPNRCTTVMVRVAFPVYSRTETVEDMQELRARMVRVSASALFPFLAMMVATAPVLIPWLFGARWEPSVVPLQILAFAGMAAVLFESVAPVLLASGRVRSLLGYNAIALALYGGAVFVAAPHGLTAVCLTVVGVHVVLLAGTYYVLLHGRLGIPIRDLWGDLVPAGVATAMLLAAAAPVTALLDGAELPSLVTLLSAGVAGGAAYLATLRLLFPSAWADLDTLVRRGFLGRRSPRPTEPLAQAGAQAETA
jgi:lipopolysaccharide exporter